MRVRVCVCVVVCMAGCGGCGGGGWGQEFHFTKCRNNSDDEKHQFPRVRWSKIK